MPAMQDAPSLLRPLAWSLLLALAAAAPLAAVSPADSLKADIDAYFSGVRAAFEDVASATVVQQVDASAADRHFVNALVKYPAMTTLLRANAKGVLVNEVVRGKRPQRVYRNVAAQRWFVEAKGWRPYDGAVSEKESAMLLLWARPIVVAKPSGARRFAGAVAVKVDLAECLRTVTTVYDRPFQLLVKGQVFFAHRWEPAERTHVASLQIAGLDDAQIVVPYPVAVAPPPSLATASATPAPSRKAPPRKRRHRHGSPLWPALGVIAGGALVVLFIRSRFCHHRILRELERDDEANPA